MKDIRVVLVGQDPAPGDSNVSHHCHSLIPSFTSLFQQFGIPYGGSSEVPFCASTRNLLSADLNGKEIDALNGDISFLFKLGVLLIDHVPTIE